MTTASERIQEVIQVTMTDKSKVALDSCCVQFYISDQPEQPWADCLDPIFRAGLEGKIELYISTVVVSELLTHIHFTNRNIIGYDPELDFMAIINRHFRILDVNEEVARAAGRLRGSYVPGDRPILKTPDALIGATSLTNGHALFITNDAQLADALPETNCIYLRDIALEWLSQSFPALCLNKTESISPSIRGKGLPTELSPASLKLGSIKPDPSANWKRILKDAHTVASTVNEPCVLFVLSSKKGAKMETREVLFWNESLNETRPPKNVLKRLHEHLGYSVRTGTINNSKNQIHLFIFSSLTHERARLEQPGFASKSEHQKEADAWNRYLSLFRVFRHCLRLPQVTWLLCEDGVVQSLDIAATVTFLDKAKNVLGWEYEK